MDVPYRCSSLIVSSAPGTGVRNISLSAIKEDVSTAVEHDRQRQGAIFLPFSTGNATHVLFPAAMIESVSVLRLPSWGVSQRLHRRTGRSP
jgi:hypothetical protein